MSWGQADVVTFASLLLQHTNASCLLHNTVLYGELPPPKNAYQVIAIS